VASNVALAETPRGTVVGDLAPHAQCVAVVSLVVAAERMHVGAKDDPSLGSAPKPSPAAGLLYSSSSDAPSAVRWP